MLPPLERMKQSLTQTIGFNLLYGLASSRIDNWGHVGGLVGGGLVAVLLGPHLVARRTGRGDVVLVDDPPVGILKYKAALRRSRP